MAKKFGLSELEQTVGNLGSPLDAETVKIVKVTAAVMGAKWTATDEVKAAKIAAEAQAASLRTQAASTRSNARKQAEELRKQAAAVETAANNTASDLETTAKGREDRAGKLAGYSALMK